MPRYIAEIFALKSKPCLVVCEGIRNEKLFSRGQDKYIASSSIDFIGNRGLPSNTVVRWLKIQIFKSLISLQSDFVDLWYFKIWVGSKRKSLR